MSISSTVGLAAPLLCPEQHLMSEEATGWRCFIPGQGSPLFHHFWFAPARDVWRERQGDTLGGMSQPCSAQLHLPAGHSSGAAGTVSVPQGVAAAKGGKHMQLWGLSSSSSFSQMWGKDNTAAFPCCRQERGSSVPRALQPFPALQSQETS